MPPVPVIASRTGYRPAAGRDCEVGRCPKLAVACWFVARSGRIFEERWIAGEKVNLCREHDRRAACMTGVEDDL